MPAHAGTTIELALEPGLRPLANPSESPWDPLILSYIVNARAQLIDGAPHHLMKRFCSGGRAMRFEWHYVDHHLSHEASAFLAAPFAETAVLTMDGRGEGVTTSLGRFVDGEYKRLKQVELPHSLGLLYESVTGNLGVLHSSDEYKVMALASYGKPAYVDAFRKKQC